MKNISLFLFCASCCLSVHAAGSSDVLSVDGVKVRITTSFFGTASPEDVKKAALAIQGRVKQESVRKEDSRISRFTLAKIIENWARYTSVAVPSRLNEHRTIELYFVLANAEKEDPQLVVKLGDDGAMQWKGTYDLDREEVVSLETSNMSQVDTGASLSETLSSPISIEFDSQSRGVMITNLADMYGLKVSIPEELFRGTFQVKVDDQPLSVVIGAILQGTGYRLENVNGLLVVKKEQAK